MGVCNINAEWRRSRRWHYMALRCPIEISGSARTTHQVMNNHISELSTYRLQWTFWLRDWGDWRFLSISAERKHHINESLDWGRWLWYLEDAGCCSNVKLRRGFEWGGPSRCSLYLCCSERNKGALMDALSARVAMIWSLVNRCRSKNVSGISRKPLQQYRLVGS